MPSPIYPPIRAGAVFNVEDYGAVKCKYASDGVSTISSTAFTSATAAFTSADVGKFICAFKAGDSGNQSRTSTINTVTNATDIVLANNCGRNATNVRFWYGADQSVGIQAAIDAAAAAGGGTVFLPGFYFCSTITLKRHVYLQSYGKRGGGLILKPSVNAPVVTNDLTTNNNAQFSGVLDMTIVGSRDRQADVSTSLSSNYTAGNTTLALTDATNFLNSGTVKMVNGGTTVWAFYSSKSGNTLSGVVGGRHDAVDGNVTAAGSTVTQATNNGVYWHANSASTQGTFEDDFDSHLYMSNVEIYMCKGFGVLTRNRADHYLDSVNVYYCDYGFDMTFDSWLHHCDAGQIANQGFQLTGNQQHLTSCVAWYCGVTNNNKGIGFLIEPTTAQPTEGCTDLVACTTQDNYAEGFVLKNADQIMMQGCAASSNSQGSDGTYAAIRANSLTYSKIDCVCTERGNGGATLGQKNALFIDAGSIGNTFDLTHARSGASSGGAAMTAVKSGSVVSGSNVIRVNGLSSETVPALHSGFLGTVGLPGVAATAVTTAVSNTSYFQYLGRCNTGLTTIDLVCRVTTLVSTITWAEVGVFKGTPVANGAATLTRLGFTDVAATFNGTGIKKTTVALTGCNAGDDLWVAYGSQATQAFQLRGTQVDDIQSGVLQEKATTRISTVAAATAMTLSAASLVGAWFAAKL